MKENEVSCPIFAFVQKPNTFYIYDKNELNSLLKKIFYSKSNFVNWKNTYKKKREQFVQEYFPKIGKSSAKILADEITKNIRFNSCSKV